MSEPINCQCRECPIDLTTLFPGARISYEDPAFERTLCQWHWLITFERAKGMTVAPSGTDQDGRQWLWVDRMPRRALQFLSGDVQKMPSEKTSLVTCQVPVSCAATLDRLFHARRD